MKELLEFMEKCESDEDDTLIFLERAVWLDDSVELLLKLQLPDGARHTWSVNCDHVLSHNIKHGVAQALDLIEDHPLLWEFREQNGSAFFSGAPTHVPAAIGALYETHESQVGAWIPFGSYFNPLLPLPKLLSTGNGLLARGPVRLLNLYSEVLGKYGTQVNVVFTHAPRNAAVKLLLIGDSYFIGEHWAARNQSE